MAFIPLNMTALSPLAFPERKPGVQFRQSLPYVPGAALYGALGMHIGDAGDLDAEQFGALFRQLRCHNAYPAHEGDDWVRPLPATAIQRKAADNDEQPHDSLVARVCWEQQQPHALIYAPTDDEGRPWEAVGRQFYTLQTEEGKPWSGELKDLGKTQVAKRTVTQRVLTRVGINRRRGTAEDGRLYSPLVLSEVTHVKRDGQLNPEPTQFRGSIVIPDGDTITRAALAEITHIGGRQTTGLGAVEIVENSTEEDAAEQIKERVGQLTQQFQDQTELFHALGGSEWRILPNSIFTINLLSDAILLDNGWVPTNEISSEMLNELTGIEARLVRSFTATHIVGGWNVSWQRPKQTHVAVMMGGVFVFQATSELSDAAYTALAQLQHDGIGERRAEGYGQVRICDEFHVMTDDSGGTK